jgi:hypothetical protein
MCSSSRRAKAACQVSSDRFYETNPISRGQNSDPFAKWLDWHTPKSFFFTVVHIAIILPIAGGGLTTPCDRPAISRNLSKARNRIIVLGLVARRVAQVAMVSIGGRAKRLRAPPRPVRTSIGVFARCSQPTEARKSHNTAGSRSEFFELDEGQ